VEADTDDLYTALTRVQMEAIRGASRVIEGVAEAIAELRARGVGIGATTGYSREAGAAAAAELRPDVLVTVDDVPAGRPEPWMLLRAMELLRAYPPALVVKLGDTPVDMAEGRNAGTWAIGVSETGNEMGLAADTLVALAPGERASRAAAAAERLCAAGAHWVVASAAELVAVVRGVELRLAAGERP
jgi:phosphonoacetaldehyde hydrolase